MAFLMAAGIAVSALAGQIFLLPFAIVPVAAGIGILRGRVWSAWGFALYTLAQLVPVAIVLSRSSSIRTAPPGANGAVVIAVFLVPLFFFAGRSLAATGAQHGRAWVWIALSVITTVPVLFVRVFVVPTGTMENTLLAGDRLLVQRLPKKSPARGDLIVFFYPIDRTQIFVKRVIGVPGDRIRIANKVLYRNGIALDEPYAVHKTDSINAYRDNFPVQPDSHLFAPAREMLARQVVNGEVIVPDGKYFVLGDNRDLSLDSRYWGFIGWEDLIGRPLMIYDSETPPGGEDGHQIRWNRLFQLL